MLVLWVLKMKSEFDWRSAKTTSFAIAAFCMVMLIIGFFIRIDGLLSLPIERILMIVGVTLGVGLLIYLAILGNIYWQWSSGQRNGDK